MRLVQRILDLWRPKTPDGISVRFKRYSDSIDLTGQNIVALADATREDARRLLPFLADPEQMQQKVVPAEEATASLISEVGDEIHEFLHVTQGGIKIRRLLLRDGCVIELMLG